MYCLLGMSQQPAVVLACMPSPRAACARVRRSCCAVIFSEYLSVVVHLLLPGIVDPSSCIPSTANVLFSNQPTLYDAYALLPAGAAAVWPAPWQLAFCRQYTAVLGIGQHRPLLPGCCCVNQGYPSGFSEFNQTGKHALACMPC